MHRWTKCWKASWRIWKKASNNSLIRGQIRVKTIAEIFDSTGLCAYHCAPMPASPIPAYVDTRKVFPQQDPVAGTVALERLPRFRACLAKDEGQVEVSLNFVTDNSGRRLITGKLQARVQVTCQRCLEPLGIVLEDDIKLALLKDESGVEGLDGDLDPWICADTKLVLAELVEEQLMLCLPIVSYHEATDCSSRLGYSKPQERAAQTDNNGRENPFSVLKSLKNND